MFWALRRAYMNPGVTARAKMSRVQNIFMPRKLITFKCVDKPNFSLSLPHRRSTAIS